MYKEKCKILNILHECEEADNPSLVFEFASTSKITFAGGGIAAIACNNANRQELKKTLTVQTIGFDKINMLRHARYFMDVESVDDHMKRHAKILRPKFEMVIKTMERDLGDTGCGTWTSPKGGYFITYEAPKGTASRIVELAKEAGVILTPAGAPFPYHMDPNDSVIRFAPSLPPIEELEQAADIFTVCARIAYLEKLILAKA